MGNGSSNDHVKGPGLFSVQSASGALPEFVDFYDRPEKNGRYAFSRRFFFSTRSNTHTHTHTARTSAQVLEIRNKINVVFVRSDNNQYVSDWLRLDSTRLAPHGMFTSRAEKKKTPPKKEQTPQHKKKRTMSRERELSDLGKGLRLVCATSVEDNSGVATEKINIGDFIDVLNANHRWEPASVRDLAVRQVVLRFVFFLRMLIMRESSSGFLSNRVCYRAFR